MPEHLTLAEVRTRITQGWPGSSYQGFPVLNDGGQLVGVVTRLDLLDSARMPTELVGDLTIRNHAVIFEDNTLSEANALMVREGVGRLPVVDHDNNASSSVLSRAGISCQRAIGESSRSTNVSGAFAGSGSPTSRRKAFKGDGAIGADIAGARCGAPDRIHQSRGEQYFPGQCLYGAHARVRRGGHRVQDAAANNASKT